MTVHPIWIIEIARELKCISKDDLELLEIFFNELNKYKTEVA